MARTIISIEADCIESLRNALGEIMSCREVRAIHPSEIYTSHGSSPELFVLRLVELDMGDGSHVYNISITPKA